MNMTDAMDRTIEAIASEVRRLLKSAAVPYLEGLREFPSGSCGDTCLVLAEVLRRRGQIGFQYVEGKRNGLGHAWLERGDLIVDITADQFPEQAENPVIVSRSSQWHGSFERENVHPVNLKNYDDRTQQQVASAVDQLLGVRPGS